MENNKMKWHQIDRQLLKVKGFYLISFAAIGCLFPFITLYMKAIGLSKLQAGIVFGVMPFALFIVQPTMGVIADKFQKHKICVALCCIFTAVCFNLIQLVPPLNINVTRVKVLTNCEQSGTFISDCNIHSGDNLLKQLCPLKFDLYQETFQNVRPVGPIVQTTSNYTVNAFSHNISHDINLDCSLNCYEEGASDLMCLGNKTNITDTMKCLTPVKGSSGLNLLNMKVLQNRFYNDLYGELNTATCHGFEINLLEFQGQQYRYMYCLRNATLSCELSCNPIGSCNDNSDENSNTSSFWIFFFFLLLGNIGYAPILSLLDAIAYDVLGSEKRHKWGQQRLWGNVSLALFAVMAGGVMDQLKSEHNNYFQFSFYGYGMIFILLALNLCFAKISGKLACVGVLKGAIIMFKDGKRLAFLTVILYFGILVGGIEAFLFWFLEAELENTLKIIPGLCMFFNCTGEIILFYFSGRIIKCIGRLKCLYVAFIAHFIRFFSYSFLTNAWFVLPIELLNGVTFSLMWTAATSYGSIIAPRGLLGTMQGVLSGIYFGFAKGVGSLITGELYTEIGIRWTFRLYGILSLVLLIVYFLLNLLVFKEDKDQQDELSVKHREKPAAADVISENTEDNDEAADLHSSDENFALYSNRMKV